MSLDEKIYYLLEELSNSKFDDGPQIILGNEGRFDTIFTKESYFECLDVMAQVVVEIVEPHILIRVMKGHVELPVSDYTSEVALAQKSHLTIDMDKLTSVIAGGATVNLNMLERLSTNYRAFSRMLETELHCRLQTNLYYNEGQVAGFSPHYDTHDLIVLQIYGEKRWKISDDVTSDVSVATPSRQENAPTVWEQDVVLSAGDVIVLPRGTWHSVAGTGEPSLHLTIGLRIPTFEDYLRWLGSHAGASETLRQRSFLPGCSDVTESGKTLIQGLEELSERGLTFERFATEFVRPQIALA